MALGLDLTIRRRSDNRHSLDDVMRALWQQFGEHFYQGQPKGLSETGFVQIVKQATGVDVRDEIAQWVEQTADVPLEKLLRSQGFELNWIAKDQTPEIGATFKPHGESLTIRQVIEGGSAHRAGLSAGDILVACNGLRIGNSANSFKQLLAAYQPGETVQLQAFRGDVLQARMVKLAAPAASTCEIKPLKAS